jgi:hypothetical protein
MALSSGSGSQPKRPEICADGAVGWAPDARQNGIYVIQATTAISVDPTSTFIIIVSVLDCMVLASMRGLQTDEA